MLTAAAPVRRLDDKSASTLTAGSLPPERGDPAGSSHADSCVGKGSYSHEDSYTLKETYSVKACYILKGDDTRVGLPYPGWELQPREQLHPDGELKTKRGGCLTTTAETRGTGEAGRSEGYDAFGG